MAGKVDDTLASGELFIGRLIYWKSLSTGFIADHQVVTLNDSNKKLLLRDTIRGAE